MPNLKVSILQGIYKNKKISIPDKIKGHNSITSQKIKESVFQIVYNNIASPKNTAFIDLFCGSGQMGFEAISRNFKSVFFYDISRERINAASEWSNKNLNEPDRQKCHFENKDSVRLFSDILKKNYLDFDDVVFFADPPYNFIYKKKLIIDYITGEFLNFSSLPDFEKLFLVIQTSRFDIFKSAWFKEESFIYKKYPDMTVKFYAYGKTTIVTMKKSLPHDTSAESI